MAVIHCINRCVRRSWLCGEDEYTGESFEHRKPWVEKRFLELGTIFACGIYSYAVMSNHLHLVVHMSLRQNCVELNLPSAKPVIRK